jgi:hypothetical protein
LSSNPVEFDQVDWLMVPVGTPVTVYLDGKDGVTIPIAVGFYQGIRMHSVPADAPQAEITILPLNHEEFKEDQIAK